MGSSLLGKILKTAELKQACRHTGLDVIGETAWGTHFCNFFETKHDLLDILVPYFKTGLENNEYCLWIATDPISVDDGIEALRQALPEVDSYLENKCLEILPHTEWYLKNGVFDIEAVMSDKMTKLQDALDRGFDGMRMNCNEGWLDRKTGVNFAEYERRLNERIAGLPILVLCSYPLTKCNATDILDVAHFHEMAVSKRDGHLEVVENSEIRNTKAQLKKMNEELDRRVVERTAELTKAYEALKCSEQRFSRLFHLNPVSPMLLSTKEGMYVEANEAFQRLFGLTSQQLKGKKVKELNVWIDLNIRDSFVARIETGGCVMNEEIQLIGENGKILDILYSMFMLQMEDGPMILSISLDITARIESEKKLRQSEESLDILINSSLEQIWLVDSELKLIKANDAFHAALKKSTGIEIRTGDSAMPVVLPEKLKERWNGFYQRALGGENVCEVTIDIDLKQRYFQIALHPVYDEKHQVIGVGCFSRDVTELTLFRRSLEEQVAERTKDLQEALGKEKELTNLKARFASMVSHEFRSPLSTIMISINHIRKYKSRMSPETIDKKIEVVLEQTQHMTRMLESVLNLSRTTDHKIKVAKKKLNIKSILEGLIEEVVRLDNNNHTVQYHLKFENDKIKSDEGLLRNIFLNVLNNAIKFSAHGTVVLVDGRENNGIITILIEDHGFGIPQVDLPLIFEPFHRGTNAASTQGSGLGLSIAKTAIELLGGSISVANKRGGGAVFSAAFPVK